MIKIDNNKKIKLLFILILSGFIISAIFIMTYTSDIQNKYPKIDFANEVKGNISKLSSYQSVALLEFEDGGKFMIIDSRNYAYDPYLIQDFLKVGDQLEKKKNSDTLSIRRNDKVFIFVIGDDL